MWFAFFSTSDNRGFSSTFPLEELAFSEPSRLGDDMMRSGFPYSRCNRVVGFLFVYTRGLKVSECCSVS